MALIFLGRKNEDVYNGDLNQLFALVARALQSLVLKVVVNLCKLLHCCIFTHFHFVEEAMKLKEL